MSCERVQALMGVSAELDRAERLLLSQHLRDCAACRVAMLDEERVRAYLAGLPELPVPGRLLAGLMAIPTVAQTQPTAALGRWLRATSHDPLRWWPFALATVLATASLSWVLLERPINDLKRYFPYRPGDR